MSAQPVPTSFDAPELTEESRAQIDETLALTARFFHLLFEDPTIADDIPASASVIFLPHDDADLAARNRAAGDRLRAAGQLVHFVEV